MRTAAREGLAPLHGLVTSYSRRVKDAFSAIRGWGGLPDENRRLAEEIVILRNELNGLRSLETENVELRRQLGFARHSPHTLLPAEVIARDIGGWWQTLRIGLGSAAGVEANRAVLTSSGLVGKVAESTLRTSDVLLILDPGCKVSALITRTGSHGILSGKGVSIKGRMHCTLDLVNKDVPVKRGDKIVTSGLGGVFPPGIVIGYVDKVNADKSGLYQRADVLPSVDFGSLNYVFVMAPEDEAVPEEVQP